MESIRKKIKNKILIISSITFLIIFLSASLYMVNADMGNKPSITIEIINLEDSNYIIDLLTVFEQYTMDLSTGQTNSETIEFSNDYDEYSTDNKDLRNEPIYLYHNNSWMATAMRDELLWGSVIGNDNYTNTFSYMNVPKDFKIILQLPNGELKISEQITRQATDSIYILDANTMEVKDVTKTSLSTYTVPVFILSITIIVELCIGLMFFKVNRKKVILISFFTNFTTNLLLQIIMNIIGNKIFVIAEFIITIIEAIIYMLLLKDYSKKKIIIYSIIANFVTMYLTFSSVMFFL